MGPCFSFGSRRAARSAPSSPAFGADAGGGVPPASSVRRRVLRVIDSYAANLRKKLVQATGGQHYIETLWGRGYALRDPTNLSVVQEPSLQWTTHRKAAVVAAVQNGEIAIEEALRRHQLSEEKFRTWHRLYKTARTNGTLRIYA